MTRRSAARRWVFGAVLGAASLAAAGVAAAPNEAAYGAAASYPHGDRGNWFRVEHLVGSFTAMERLFPTRVVAAGREVRALPRHEKEIDWPFLQPYLDTHPATGLLVLKDGKILVERYQYGRQADDRFTSFSMAKTVVAMAIGIAVGEGHLQSLDDAVDAYVPALATTAWKGVAIRDVLHMASGVAFDETYDKADSDIARLSARWVRQQGSLLAELSKFTRRDEAPGARFKYSSADTQVLAEVLASATGRPLADYVSEKLWKPMGAEADAAWVLDATGSEAAYCCLSARLRDWGRLGQLLLERGRRDGQSVIAQDWIEAATTVRFRDGFLQPRRATPYFGYGYQTWVFPDGLGFALMGVRGQAVFVHPALRLVMVQTAVWPSASEPVLGRQRDELWRDLVRAAGRL